MFWESTRLDRVWNLVVTDDESEEESPFARARLMVCLYLRLVGVAYVKDMVVSGVALTEARLRIELARVVLKETTLVARL